ncbi:MAG: glycosyltransferase family 4 protein [Bacteroidales bacterium]|nr:glycosyltransferase family 4 protein [Bacteroidales bacterium]
MKVLLFSTGFYEYMIELANAMSEIADVVLMIPSNRIDNIHIKSISSKVKFEPFNLVDYKSIRDNSKMIFDIVKKIKKHNPDIIHIQHYGHRWFWLAYFFLLKYKIVNTIHDPMPHIGDMIVKRAFVSEFFGKIFNFKFIVHGEVLKKQLNLHKRIKVDKIFVIPHGHLGLFKNWNKKVIKKEKKHIIFFGRIWEYKGLEYFIKAEPVVSKKISDIKFIVAGKGEDFEKYEKIISNKNSFIIKNYRISNEETDELFNQCSICVLPYIEASQSGVAAIALAYGLPVIATSVGSLPEVIENGVNGFIVKQKNEKEIAERIIELISNNNLYETMSKNAINTSNNKLSWKNIARQTLETYKS